MARKQRHDLAVLLNERTRGSWNDPPRGGHALDIGRDGVVHTIDNGLATADVVAIVDELRAQ